MLQADLQLVQRAPIVDLRYAGGRARQRHTSEQHLHSLPQCTRKLGVFGRQAESFSFRHLPVAGGFEILFERQPSARGYRQDIGRNGRAFDPVRQVSKSLPDRCVSCESTERVEYDLLTLQRSFRELRLLFGNLALILFPPALFAHGFYFLLHKRQCITRDFQDIALPRECEIDD